MSASGGRAGRDARRGVRVAAAASGCERATDRVDLFRPAFVAAAGLRARAEARVAAFFLVLLVLFVLLVVARFVAMETWALAAGLRLCCFALVVVFFLRSGRVCRDVAGVRPVLRPLDRPAVFRAREATRFFAPPAGRPAVWFRRVDRFRGVDLGRVLATAESFRSLTAVR